MRLMSRCTTASTAPTTSVSTASTQMIGCQLTRSVENVTVRTRSSPANPAALAAAAIKEQRGGEGPEHEVLHGRLARFGAPAVEASQDVKRDRQDLEAEEEHQEIVRGPHQDASGTRQQREHVKLDAVEALADEIAVG